VKARRPLHRRLFGPRVLRLGYRLAAVAARSWWSVFGSHNVGAQCVLTHDGAVLLVRHTYGDRRSWEFPGGFVRRREQPRAAAGRELVEELGIDPPELEALGSIVHEHGRRRDIAHYFHAEVADRRVWPDEVELAEVGWFRADLLPRRLGDDVAEVLERHAGRAAKLGGPVRSGPESLASLETDPGSPVRG
jgi:ADP-ribose pyrophosphatase YjhB (NUDIX family)